MLQKSFCLGLLLWINATGTLVEAKAPTPKEKNILQFTYAKINTDLHKTLLLDQFLFISSQPLTHFFSVMTQYQEEFTRHDSFSPYYYEQYDFIVQNPLRNPAFLSSHAWYFNNQYEGLRIRMH